MSSQDLESQQEKTSASELTMHDWARTPSAMIVAVILAIASISGLAWSIKRSSTKEPITEYIESIPAEHASEPIPSVAQRIDINTASAAQLELLPAIGPALAKRIVDNRGEAGRFNRIEDLDRVPGIGPKTIEKLRAEAIVND